MISPTALETFIPTEKFLNFQQKKVPVIFSSPIPNIPTLGVCCMNGPHQWGPPATGTGKLLPTCQQAKCRTQKSSDLPPVVLSFLRESRGVYRYTSVTRGESRRLIRMKIEGMMMMMMMLLLLLAWFLYSPLWSWCVMFLVLACLKILCGNSGIPSHSRTWIWFTVGLPCALLVSGAAIYRSGDATAFSGHKPCWQVSVAGEKNCIIPIEHTAFLNSFLRRLQTNYTDCRNVKCMHILSWQLAKQILNSMSWIPGWCLWQGWFHGFSRPWTVAEQVGFGVDVSFLRKQKELGLLLFVFVGGWGNR